MARLINVCVNNQQKLDRYENVNITDIDNIVNYSVDFIRFDFLQFFDYNTGQNILHTLINKLKLSGSVTLLISNYKTISRLYADSILSDGEFLEKIQNCRSVWSADFIYSLINQKYTDTHISKIQYDNNHNIIYVTIERKAL